MKSALALLLFLAVPQIAPQTPKNDPNGIWESASGTKYTFRLSGTDLHVQIVEGSNPRYAKYEVELKNMEDANLYRGKGYFVAKVPSGKECKFDTEWEFVVLTPDHIMGSTTNIVPDPDTCAAKERTRAQLDLKKK